MSRLAGVLLVLLLAALLPQQALAHATLVDSSPADGSLLKTAPVALELRFNEPVEVLSLLLVDAGGNTTKLDGGTAATQRLEAALPPGLGMGTHLLSWRVVSADGHPVGGSLIFSIGQASGGDAAPGNAVENLITATNPGPLIAARWALLLALALGVGGCAALAWLGPVPAGGLAKGVLLAVLALGSAAGILLIGLEGLEAHALPLSSFWRPLTWRTGLRSGFASTAALAVLAMGLAGASLWLRTGAAKVSSAVAIVMAGAALAVSGHAGTAPPRWLMPLIVAVHVAAVLAWAGALTPLAGELMGRARNARALPLFSRLAVPLFSVVLLSGFVLALVQAGTLGALLGSVYGTLLLVKLALVACVLGLAGINRFRLTEPALTGETGARMWLARSIRAEIILAVAILGIAATWRITPPPRALAQMREPKFQIHMHGTEAMASVSIRPARVGPVKVTIEPKTPDLAPLKVQEIALFLTGDAPGMEPLRRVAKPVGSTAWEIEDLTIPAPGRWRVRVELLINDFERTTLDAVILLQR